MRVMIIGAGKVGYSLAEMLSMENHDVVVIDKASERLKVVDESLDVQTILGSGSSKKVLEDAGVDEVKMLIAVTEFDELNMVACITAKHYGVKKTVARVRDPEYVGDDKASNSFLGIDLIINPERVTAKEIAKLLEVPEAINVDYYADGKVQLLELKIDESSPVLNVKLKDLPFEYPYLIVAILRGEKMIIPSGEDMIKANDFVFVIGKTKEMVKIEELLGEKRTSVENVFILGAGRVGYYLAQILSKKKKKYSVKVVDKDIKKCQRIADDTDNVLVLKGDGTDTELLKNESIDKTDAFVAVTGDDKVNLLVSLMAKNMGAKRTLAQVRRSDYAPMMEQVGIDIAVTPRELTAAAILKNIRQGKIVSLTLLGGAKAEVIELIVSEDYSYAKKPLKDIKFPKGAILGAILREGKALIPSGDDWVLPGDQVMVFALPSAIANVENFFENKKRFGLF
ncbi:trk system potassium uptake protein TrkA [Desulfitispora alkaliphila]|uniref:Trk system potassium transporter TrkA n=1 Tax=Desulfitispora alkaliphila TaxID=622674 RepID=UPI003D1B5685